jgi:phosphohistidine phosphatase SixA
MPDGNLGSSRLWSETPRARSARIASTEERETSDGAAMSRIVLLRHALAGHKWANPAADVGRGLNREGREAVAGLPAVLLEHVVPRALLSSPYRRCTDTIAPAAERFGLTVETQDELLPDAGLADAMRLLLEAVEGAVLCTHGELITRVLGGLECEKGGFWVIGRRGEAIVPLVYVPPGGHGRRLPDVSHS